VAIFRRSKKSGENVERKERRRVAQDREERARLAWLSDSIDQLQGPGASSWRPEEREMQVQAWRRERDDLRRRRR
jgi:hypothetical protein